MNIQVTNQAIERALPISLIHCWTEVEGVEASVRLSYKDTTLYLSYMVQEPQLRRMVTEHNGRVWEDSCVEVFLKRADKDEYINIECSASSKLLIAQGPERAGRIKLPVSLIETIPVRISILENNNYRSRWKAELQLDLQTLGLVEKHESLADVALCGNLYWCGDLHEQKHYLAAAQIGTLEPDFHTPQFFVPFHFMT